MANKPKDPNAPKKARKPSEPRSLMLVYVGDCEVIGASYNAKEVLKMFAATDGAKLMDIPVKRPPHPSTEV